MSTDIHALSGAYAIDALDDEERADFERHLADCPTCQAEVDGLREAAATIAELHATEPPAAMRQRVLADIRTVRPLPPLVQRRTGRRAGAVRRRWVGLVAAAAAVIALGGVVWHPWDRPSSGPQLSAVTQVERAPDVQQFTTKGPDGSEMTVYRSVSLNRAAVVAHDLADAPEGKVYQLWLQDPAGVMRPAGFLAAGTSTSAPLTGAVSSAEGAGMTVEPAGGSPAPTSDPVALVAFTS